MMNKLILIFLATTFCLNTYADRVGNGGGLAEQNFASAAKNFKNDIGSILESGTNSLSAFETNLLNDILQSMSFEREEFGIHLDFQSRKLKPELFKGTSEERVWVTKTIKGSPILINTDRIYVSENGISMPLEIDQCFRIIFMANAWQHNVEDEFYLEGLSRKLIGILKQPLIASNNELPKKGVSPEQWIGRIFSDLPSLLENCLADKDCVSDTDQKAVLSAILKNLEHELYAKDLIQVRSGREYPDLFLIEGEIKSAVTGLKVGDPIYFNTDLLYQKNGRELRARSFASLGSLLLHELGHHTGEINHFKLDQIGNLLFHFVEKNSMNVVFNEDPWAGFDHKSVSFSLRNISFPGVPFTIPPRPLVQLADELYVINFTQELDKQWDCPKGSEFKTYRINEMGWTGDTQWSGESRKVKFGYEGQEWIIIQPLIYKFNLDATLLCVDENGEQRVVPFQKELNLLYSREYTNSRVNEHLPAEHAIFERIIN